MLLYYNNAQTGKDEPVENFHQLNASGAISSGATKLKFTLFSSADTVEEALKWLEMQALSGLEVANFYASMDADDSVDYLRKYLDSLVKAPGSYYYHSMGNSGHNSSGNWQIFSEAKDRSEALEGWRNLHRELVLELSFIQGVASSESIAGIIKQEVPDVGVFPPFFSLDLDRKEYIKFAGL